MERVLAFALAAMLASFSAIAQQTAPKVGKPGLRCQVEGDRDRGNDRAADRGRWSDRGARGGTKQAKLPPCDPKNPYAATRPGDPNPYATRAGDPNPHATKAGMPNPYATKAGAPNPYATRAGDPNPYAPPPAGTPRR